MLNVSDAQERADGDERFELRHACDVGTIERCVAYAAACGRFGARFDLPIRRIVAEQRSGENRRNNRRNNRQKNRRKALFRNVKRLNHMEIFCAEKIAKKTMRLPRHKGPHACRSNTGNSAGRESPDPKTQAIESAADFAVKKFSHRNPPTGRESLGYRAGEGWCAATIAGSFSNLLRADFCFGEGQTSELGGAGAKPALI